MSNEQDLVPSPKPVAEPPQRSGISRIKYLRRITSSVVRQYEAVLGAYGRAPQMFGEDIVVASNQIGDSGGTQIVNIPLPASLLERLKNNREPIKKEDKLLLVRPETDEAILVESESNSSPSVVVEELLSKPAQATTFKPPFEQEWPIIEVGLETQPSSNNMLQFPQTPTKATEVLTPQPLDNLRTFIRPLTNEELKKAA